MIKIAIMLCIHNCPQQANIFIRQCLLYSGCEVFVHIDQKAKSISDRLIEDKRVHILPKSILVSWGDYSQIESNIYLMKYIQRYGEFDYYSLHSGNDLFVRPVQEFVDYLEKDNKYAYLDCYPLPWNQWQYGGGLGRLELIWPPWMRKRLEPHSFKRYIRAMYGRMYSIPLFRRRKLPEGVQFYGKSAFYTISQKCVSDILRFVENNLGFINIFRSTLSGDEIFFNTIVHLVACKEDEIDEHNNLRYDDFVTVNRKSVGAPKILTVSDIDSIEKSQVFFARKFDLKEDKAVIKYFVRKSEGGNQKSSEYCHKDRA